MKRSSKKAIISVINESPFEIIVSGCKSSKDISKNAMHYIISRAINTLYLITGNKYRAAKVNFYSPLTLTFVSNVPSEHNVRGIERIATISFRDDILKPFVRNTYSFKNLFELEKYFDYAISQVTGHVAFYYIAKKSAVTYDENYLIESPFRYLSLSNLIKNCVGISDPTEFEKNHPVYRLIWEDVKEYLIKVVGDAFRFEIVEKISSGYFKSYKSGVDCFLFSPDMLTSYIGDTLTNISNSIKLPEMYHDYTKIKMLIAIILHMVAQHILTDRPKNNLNSLIPNLKDNREAVEITLSLIKNINNLRSLMQSVHLRRKCSELESKLKTKVGLVLHETILLIESLFENVKNQQGNSDETETSVQNEESDKNNQSGENKCQEGNNTEDEQNNEGGENGKDKGDGEEDESEDKNESKTILPDDLESLQRKLKSGTSKQNPSTSIDIEKILTPDNKWTSVKTASKTITDIMRESLCELPYKEDDFVLKAQMIVIKSKDDYLKDVTPSSHVKIKKVKFAYICDSDKRSNEKKIYKEKVKSLMPYIKKISSIISLTSYAESKKIFGLKSGSLDENKIVEAANGIETVFYQKSDYDEVNEFDVAFLIDFSGSMASGVGSKTRSAYASEAAIIVSEAVKRVKGVQSYIYGFTSRDFTREPKPPYDKLYVIKEKNIDNSVILNRGHAYEANADGRVLDYLRKRIRMMTTKRVLLFIISDGRPHAVGYSRETLTLKHMKSVVNKMKSDGFVVFQIGINLERIYQEKVFGKKCFDMTRYMYSGGNEFIKQFKNAFTKEVKLMRKDKVTI